MEATIQHTDTVDGTVEETDVSNVHRIERVSTPNEERSDLRVYQHGEDDDWTEYAYGTVLRVEA